MVTVMNISTQNTTNSAVPGLPKLPDSARSSGRDRGDGGGTASAEGRKTGGDSSALENGDYDLDAILEKGARSNA